jgi:putative ABC transport system permease protein
VDNERIILPGETAQSEENHIANQQIVRANYLSTMEIPLLRGRGFNGQDDAGAPRVAIVSETFARKFFPDQDPIGKRFGFDEKTEGKIEIIGIARDTKYNSQREDIEPQFYLPWQQQLKSLDQMFFALRIEADTAATVTAVRNAVHEVDSNVPVTDFKTQEAQASETVAREQVFARLFTFFGVLVLLLSAIGLYGVMAYSVAQRTGEIGIRMALGAQTRDVLRLVLWQGMKLVVVGLIFGAIAAFASKKVIASQLYGVGAADPTTFIIVGSLLLITALLACWFPARRATKVDPMVALRNE